MKELRPHTTANTRQPANNQMGLAALSAHTDAMVQSINSGAVHIAACALRVKAGDDWIRLMPAGRFEAPRGALLGSGPWLLTESNARDIIARAALRSTDIVIDYEHQTLMAEHNGKPAPASGWVDPRSLEWRDDGLYGQVRWTAAASVAIDGDEYRYLSPVFPYASNTGEVLDLLHVALTNNPAIDTAVSVLAAARMGAHSISKQAAIPPQEDDVNREMLIAALALASDATDEQIEQAIAALKSNAAQAGRLREELNVTDDADPVAAVAALKAGAQPDMTQFVPRAVYTEAQQQLAALKSGGETAELDRLIETGMKDGRIAGEATASWLREQGLAACKSFLKDAPSIAALTGETQTKGKKPNPDTDVTDLEAAEIAVCKSMDLDIEEYRKVNA